MLDLIPLLIFLAISTLVVRFVISGTSAREQKWLWLAYAVHAAAGVVQIWIALTVYGGSDQLLYFDTAEHLRDLFLSAPGTWALPILKLSLGSDVLLPIRVIGVGSGTGAMSGITTWLLVLGLSSLYTVCVAFAVFAFIGQVAMYRALREVFPPELRMRVLAVVFFIPSVMFWSSAILKESVALAGLGWCILGLWRFLFTKHRARGVVFLLFGVVPIAVVKAYTLPALLVAAAVWYYWSQRARDWSPQALLKNIAFLGVVVVCAVIAMQYLGERYPLYSVDRFAEQAAFLQNLYYQTEAGSTYQLGAATADAQIANAPLALLTVLFRPFIFEAHNITSLMNSLEMSAIVFFILWLLYTRGFRRTVSSLIRSPILMFFLTFILLFGTGVGLAAPNLGSLSRYRILLMPFYVLSLVSLLPLRTKSVARAPLPYPPRSVGSTT